MTKVVICNCQTDQNLGSAALNEAAVVTVKSALPSCEITMVTDGIAGDLSRDLFRHSLERHPDVAIVPPPHDPLPGRGGSSIASALRGELSLRAGRVKITGPALEALSHADLAVSRAGLVIADPGSSRLLLAKYLIMFPMLAAARLGVPTASLPTSVIAPSSRSGAWFERRVLTSIDLVAVRDPLAAEVARSMGARDVRTYTDSAFALPPPTPDEVRIARETFGVESSRYAVLTARLLGGDAGDERKLALQAATARALLDDGSVDACLLIRQTGPPKGDLPVTNRLADAIGPGSRVCDWDYSHRDLIALYAGATVVLTQHLHSFIFSVLSGTPCLVMSTDTNKVEGLVHGMALPSWLVLRAGMSEIQVTEAVRRALTEAELLRGLMASSRQAARDSLLGFEVDLRAAMGSADLV